tara:strand:- start:127 stop:453 length:327 start_codon:yes stop_codon:yes gene_type:complete
MHFFGRLLWIITMLAMATVVVSFTISNDAIISLSIWPLTQNLETPIWVFGICAFVVGGIMVAILLGGQMLVIRAKLWRAELQIRKLGKKNIQSVENETNQSMLHSSDI